MFPFGQFDGVTNGILFVIVIVSHSKSKDPTATRHEAASHSNATTAACSLCVPTRTHTLHAIGKTYLTLYFSNVLLLKYPILYVEPYFQ